MEGYECTDQLNAFGHRIDFLTLTRHLVYIEDVEALKAGDPGVRIVTTEPLVSIAAAAPVRPPIPKSDRFSLHVLAELLALNEEMIEQLCLERVTVVGSEDFLTTMINQHEETADLLRTLLAGPTPVGPEIKDKATRLARTG